MQIEKKPSLYDEYAEALGVRPSQVLAVAETPDRRAFVLFAPDERIMAVLFWRTATGALVADSAPAEQPVFWDRLIDWRLAHIERL